MVIPFFLALVTDSIFNTTIATIAFTFRALLHATVTNKAFTTITGAPASQADGFFAHPAITGTGLTKIIITARAVVALVAITDESTIKTRATFPFIERHIRTVRIKSVEDADDHGEKVTEPSLIQRRTDGGVTIAFTEDVIADMGMCNI